MPSTHRGPRILPVPSNQPGKLTVHVVLGRTIDAQGMKGPDFPDTSGSEALVIFSENELSKT